MSSTIGNNLKMTIFGESHGPAIGVTLDRLPPGEKINTDEIAVQMSRRAPGGGEYATSRAEADKPEILSGLLNGKTTGAPLCAIIKNTNVKSGDYENLADIPRPSHADYAARIKYRQAADLRGGGHFSGRLTASLVFAGAVCRQILQKRGIEIAGHVCQIGDVYDDAFNPVSSDNELMRRMVGETFPVINPEAKDKMLTCIARVKKDGDSIGGAVEASITGLPAGIGSPIFGGVENVISSYIFGIPAVKGVEFGAGFGFPKMLGSEANDEYCFDGETVRTNTNNCGGIVGGITSGMPVIVRAAFKPTPSIAKTQKSVNLNTGENCELKINGRHDPCIVPRAVPCVEAALAVAVLDLIMGEYGYAIPC